VYASDTGEVTFLHWHHTREPDHRLCTSIHVVYWVGDVVCCVATMNMRDVWYCCCRLLQHSERAVDLSSAQEVVQSVFHWSTLLPVRPPSVLRCYPCHASRLSLCMWVDSLLHQSSPPARARASLFSPCGVCSAISSASSESRSPSFLSVWRPVQRPAFAGLQIHSRTRQLVDQRRSHPYPSSFSFLNSCVWEVQGSHEVRGFKAGFIGHHLYKLYNALSPI